MRNIRKKLWMGLAAITLIGCLTACEEEDSAPRRGKARDSRSVVLTEDTPTPTVTTEPTATPTPTAKPTKTPTPTPTKPPLQGNAAIFEPLFGSWIDEDGNLLIFRQVGNNEADVTVGAWYTYAVGMKESDWMASVMTISDCKVSGNGREMEFSVHHSDGDVYRFNLGTISEDTFYLTIDDSPAAVAYRKIVSGPTMGEDAVPFEFFRDYSGYWSGTSDGGFIRVTYEQNQFLVNFGNYFGEAAPNLWITNIVKGYEKNEVYVRIGFFDEEGYSKPAWMKWALDESGSAIVWKSVNDRTTFHYDKGVRFDDLKYLEDPNIIYATGLPNDFATEYLRGYDIARLKVLWKDNIIAEDGTSVSFKDIYTGGLISVHYENGKVTTAETSAAIEMD